MDARFGLVVNHDLAGYHIVSHADVAGMDAVWLDETDPRVNPMGARGIGEIVANATYDATGIRVRDLPPLRSVPLRMSPPARRGRA